MQPRTDIVEGAFRLRGVAHDFAGGARDVEQGVVSVGQLHEVQRAMAVQAVAVGVGVFVDGTEVAGRRDAFRLRLRGRG